MLKEKFERGGWKRRLKEKAMRARMREFNKNRDNWGWIKN
jgi:hypothetical protein